MTRLSSPRSPFATSLSGSARETELRMRSLFQWKKGRPPVWLIVLVGLCILLCGGLVSCRAKTSSQPTGPTFSMTQSGTESVPFDHLLGYSGTVTHTVYSDSDLSADQYLYQISRPDGTPFSLAWCSGTVYHLDLDGDGQLELLNVPSPNQLNLWRLWPDGSVRSQSLPLTPQALSQLEDDWETAAVTVQPQDGTVTLQSTSGQSRTFFLNQLFQQVSSGNLVIPADGQLPADDTVIYFYDGLTLDGQGKKDDCAQVTSYGPDSVSPGLTVLEVTLGSGQTLRWADTSASSPSLLPAYLISDDRQCLVLTLASPTSNYSAACYYILEVQGDALQEHFRLDYENESWLHNITGATLIPAEHGLQALRLPALYDKWHSPVWRTLSWSEDSHSFQLVSDDFFTDTFSLPLSDQRELTLALRCSVSPDSDSSSLTYNQVQILEGDTLLQTIDPASFIPDGRIPFEGFLANSMAGPVEIQDINFDGWPDFGLSCQSTHNEGRCWFVWNPEAEQFDYLASLSGLLTLQPQQRQLVEAWWDGEPEPVYHATLGYDQQGNLIVIEE